MPVGDHRRQQRLYRRQNRYRDGRHHEPLYFGKFKLRHRKRRQRARYPPKRARIVSTSNPERATSGVRMKIAPIMPRDAPAPRLRPIDYYYRRRDADEKRPPVRSVDILPNRRELRNEILGNILHLQPQKIHFICVDIIRTAIPFVNPTVTGRGI